MPALNNVNMCVKGTRTAHGFTLLEIMIALAVVSVLSSIAVVSLTQYFDRVKHTQAISDIRTLEAHIRKFESNAGALPETLDDIGMSGLSDPWGNPYEYLNIVTATGGALGKIRRDRFLVPLNTDYDLYSKGKDGDSRAPLTSPLSFDDLVRANNGSFVDLAEEY